jgi:hypothetical protein
MDLPPELLQQILECLVPDCPEVGDTRPVSFDKLTPEEPWYDMKRNRRALRSLCLASRSLCAMAQPLLYCVISILDEEGMVLLFRTLTERPGIGESARYLSCHLTLTQLEVIREMKRVMTRQIKSFHSNDRLLKEQFPAVHAALNVMVTALPFLNTSTGEFDEVPQILFFYIASFTKRLETLLLQVPVCDDHPEYTALFEKFYQANQLRLKAPTGDSIFGEPPLQHLKTLLLQGDPELLMHFEGDNCDCDIPDLWGCQARRYHPLYEALPSLTTLEVSSDDGVWDNMRHRRPDGTRPPYLERIRHLYLHNSIAYPRDLHHILINAPNLTTLYMTPRRDPEPYPDEEAAGMDEHPESLDAALMQPRARQQLRHLDIAWFDCTEHTNLIGASGRLTSLPALVNLDKLCIQLCVLYGTGDPTTLLTPMASLLPPNLSELTLEEWWWDSVPTYDVMPGWTPAERVRHYQGRAEYRAQAIAILSRFAADTRGAEGRTMPRLRRVTFQTKFLWTWRLDGFVSAESHFGAVAGLFAERGVEFRVQEDESECLPAEELVMS